jgi:hypothetical protein
VDNGSNSNCTCEEGGMSDDWCRECDESSKVVCGTNCLCSVKPVCLGGESELSWRSAGRVVRMLRERQMRARSMKEYGTPVPELMLVAAT